MRRRTCGVAALAAGLLAAAGCGGPEMGTVSGRVTVGGVPVTEGVVMFHPVNGPTAVGAIQKDGTYSLTTFKPGDGAVVGAHTVTISATSVGAGKMVEAASLDEEIAKSGKNATKWLVAGDVKWVVPEKYSRPETTDQKATVTGGENAIDFDLPGGPK
jgi:hypothetical protein